MSANDPKRKYSGRADTIFRHRNLTLNYDRLTTLKCAQQALLLCDTVLEVSRDAWVWIVSRADLKQASIGRGGPSRLSSRATAYLSERPAQRHSRWSRPLSAASQPRLTSRAAIFTNIVVMEYATMPRIAKKTYEPITACSSPERAQQPVPTIYRSE